MDNDIAGRNILDCNGHLIQELGTVKVEYININDIAGSGIIGHPGTSLILYSQTIHRHTNSAGIDRTKVKIELHNITLLVISSSVDYIFQRISESRTLSQLVNSILQRGYCGYICLSSNSIPNIINRIIQLAVNGKLRTIPIVFCISTIVGEVLHLIFVHSVQLNSIQIIFIQEITKGVITISAAIIFSGMIVKDESHFHFNATTIIMHPKHFGLNQLRTLGDAPQIFPIGIGQLIKSFIIYQSGEVFQSVLPIKSTKTNGKIAIMLHRLLATSLSI